VEAEQWREYFVAAIPLLINIGKAIGIFIIGWMFSKWANRLTIKAITLRNIDPALGRFLASIFQYAVLAAALIAALGAVGVETTSLVAIFASAGLAIGLALQGSLANFASGVMILFFRPFTLGDKVTAGSHTGVIKDIGLFATTLATPDNTRIIIPNSAITSNPIINITAQGTMRGAVEVGVAYGAEIDQVMKVLMDSAKSAELVLKDPEPTIAFVGLGASSLDFKVMTWCNSEDYLGMLHNVRTAVYQGLNRAGIEIPFNQIVVHRAEFEAS